MKIRINTSPIYNLILFIAIMDCGIFSIFKIPVLGEDGATTSIIAALSVILFVNCIVNKSINTALKPYRNFINFYMLLLVTFVAIMIIYSYNKYAQGPIDLFNCFRSYLYLFLVAPILFIIDKFGDDRFIKILVWSVLLILFINVVVAVLYNFTGRLLLNEVKFGIRYGRLRCTVPTAFGVSVSYVAYKLFEEKLQKNKIKWGILLGFIVFYLVYTCMTRALTIAVCVTLLTMYLLRPRAKTNQVIVWVMVLTLAIIFVASGAFSVIISSFSETNEETGNSTLARQLAREYFTTYTDKNPLFSMGFVCPSSEYFSKIFFGPNGTCCFDDLGIMNMWYHYGIIGIIFSWTLLIRLIYLFIKIYYINKSNRRVFFAGMIAYLAATQISLCAFDGQRIFSLVCMWALFEKEAHASSRTVKNARIEL